MANRCRDTNVTNGELQARSEFLFCLFVYRTVNTRETSYAYKCRVSLYAASNVSQSKTKISFRDTRAFVLPLFTHRLIMHIKICEWYALVIITCVLWNFYMQKCPGLLWCVLTFIHKKSHSISYSLQSIRVYFSMTNISQYQSFLKIVRKI